MKRLLLLLIFFAIGAKAQNKYDISLINPELLKNANAVIRTDETNFEVKSAVCIVLASLHPMESPAKLAACP